MAQATFKELCADPMLRMVPPGSDMYGDPRTQTEWLYRTETPEGQFYTFQVVLMMYDHIIVRGSHNESDFPGLLPITGHDMDDCFLARVNMTDESKFITDDEAAQIEKCIDADDFLLACAR